MVISAIKNLAPDTPFYGSFQFISPLLIDNKYHGVIHHFQFLPPRLRVCVRLAYVLN